MKILKYTILLLVILNVPPFGLFYLGDTIGNITSTLFFALIFLWFFFNEKSKLTTPLIILGIAYFFISGINSLVPTSEFINDIIKYFIFIIGSVTLMKKTNSKELCFIFLIGAISILINALIFPSVYGRYSGFYLNPNQAGFICLIGFALTYTLGNKKYKLIAQFIFAISGFMTFSRYFILLLIIVNVVSVISNKRNSISLIAGAVALLLILSTSYFQLNNERFSALQSVFSDDVDTKTITKGSREETWAIYTDIILENILIGNGYKSLHGRVHNPNFDVGVHNTYLMVLGESGIITFLLIIFTYFMLFFKSLKYFSTNPEYIYLSIVLLTYLLVTHNYFYNYIVLAMTIWLFTRVTNSVDSNSLNSV